MTLKYESEILFELMKRDGDDNPSDVLPYESELKEKYLQQVEGAYPKLQDYRPEWLNYNLSAHLPSGFPAEALTDVTQATIDNVVPYAYGSAILKGNTLVNLSENLQTITRTVNSWYREEPLIADISKLKTNIYYTVLYKLENVSGNHQNYTTIELGIGTTAPLKTITVSSELNKVGGWCKASFQLTDALIKEYPSYKKLYIRPIRRHTSPVDDESIKYTIRGFAILEGDYITNPIPFNKVFEGMQSVKMPVLTTSNEDGTKTNILTVNEDVTLRGIGEVKDELNLLTGELTQRVGEAVLDGSEDESYTIISQATKTHTSFNVRQLSGLVKTISESNTDDLLSDKLQSTSHTIYNKAVEGVHNKSNNLYINLSNEKTGGTVDGLKAYLQSNPITVQYLLKTAVIKTVDLTVTDQDGNTESIIRPIEGTMTLTTSSDTIQPTFTGEVPVEAITQNLASFIKEE